MVRLGLVIISGGIALAPCASAQPNLPLLCVVEKKLDSERLYSRADLDRFQFHVELLLEGDSVTLRRCSFAPSHGRVTCDDYTVDHVVRDPIPKIQKFYHFRSQFDVQVFSNGSFIENNGRGSIAFGKCVPK